MPHTFDRTRPLRFSVTYTNKQLNMLSTKNRTEPQHKSLSTLCCIGILHMQLHTRQLLTADTVQRGHRSRLVVCVCTSSMNELSNSPAACSHNAVGVRSLILVGAERINVLRLRCLFTPLYDARETPKDRIEDKDTKEKNSACSHFRLSRVKRHSAPSRSTET